MAVQMTWRPPRHLGHCQQQRAWSIRCRQRVVCSACASASQESELQLVGDGTVSHWSDAESSSSERDLERFGPFTFVSRGYPRR